MSHNIDQGGPPGKEVRAPHHQDPASYVEGHTTTNTDSITASGRQAVFDVLAGLRRRREHVLRSEGGDPEDPDDRRFHRASTGLRAVGFRYGFARGGTDALRRVWPFIPAEHRGDVTRIAADYDVDREVAS